MAYNPIGQGLAGLGQSVGGIFEERRTESKLKGLLQGAQGGDEEALAELAAMDPNAARTLQMQQATATEQQQTEQQQRIKNVGIIANTALGIQDPAKRRAYLIQRMNQEQDEEIKAEIADSLNMDDDQLVYDLQEAVTQVRGFTDEDQGPKIGTYNPRDYTPESFAEFRRTGDDSVLKRFANQTTVDIGGVPHRFDPARGGYYPASVGGSATGGGIMPVTAETVAGNAATIEGAKEGAKVTARGEAEASSAEAVKQRERAVQQTKDTIQVVNDLLGADLGSITGTMARMPTYSPESMDLVAAARRLESLLTAENLGLMSGVLSETDLKVIKDIGSGLNVTDNGIQMSEAGARRRLEQIRDKLQARLEGASGGDTAKADSSPPVQGARKAADGNWYVERDGKYFKVEQ